MSLGIALDVAIGLIFTYLLLSLLAATVQEAMAGVLKKRGKLLESSVAAMLKGLDQAGTEDSGLFKKVFGHTLIQNLTPQNRGPSYIPARVFSQSLLDVLQNGSQATLITQVQTSINALPDGAGKQALMALVKQTGGDIDAFRSSVEKWFDDAMDRVSGMYKRWTQIFTLGLGLGIAVVCNVDTIQIAQTLWNDGDARAAMVASAQKYTDTTKTIDEALNTTSDKVREAIKRLPLPLGWKPVCPDKPDKPDKKDECKASTVAVAMATVQNTVGPWTILGWLITALAISFGAPFWFDMLKNALNLRNSGPKPPRSTEPQTTGG